MGSIRYFFLSFAPNFHNGQLKTITYNLYFIYTLILLGPGSSIGEGAGNTVNVLSSRFSH